MKDIDKMQEKMGSKPNYGKGFNLKDNTQASPVKGINTMSQKYDMGKCKYYTDGTKGYPAEAVQGDKYGY